MANKVKRINVTFPVDLLEELREQLPARERNRFIVEATERELRRRRLNRVLQAIREQGPIWSLDDHPDLEAAEDVDRYVRRMRESWMPRPWDEIAAQSRTDREGCNDHD